MRLAKIARKLTLVALVIATVVLAVTTVTAVTSNISEIYSKNQSGYSYVAELEQIKGISLNSSNLMEQVRIESLKRLSLKPVEVKSVEVKSVEVKSVEVKSVEVKSVEVKVDRVEELPSRGNVTRSYKMKVVATAYTPYDNGNSGTGLAADGKRARGNHTIAVDPDTIPLHSKIYIPELGFWGEAHDTGGDINGHRIDICFESVREAMAWGKKTITIEIVEP